MRFKALLAGLLCVSLLGCPASNDEGPAAFSVAMDSHIGLPFIASIKDQKDRYQGFEVEISQYIADKLGRPLKIVEARWSQLPELVQKKRADLALNAIERPLGNQNAPEALSFTTHYYTAYQQLAVPQKDSFSYNLSDFSGKKVGVVASTVGALLLEELNKLKQAKIEIVSFPDPATAFQALSAGEIQATLTERAFASWYASQDKKVKLTGEAITTELPYVGLVRQDDQELLTSINQILEAGRKDPAFLQIFEKWHVSIKR